MNSLSKDIEKNYTRVANFKQHANQHHYYPGKELKSITLDARFITFLVFLGETSPLWFVNY
jgi:hypothetical protein